MIHAQLQRVGRRIGGPAMSGPVLQRLALELGGNSPSVILDVAGLDHAVRSTIVGRFFHQGQICMSTTLVIDDANVYDGFVDRFAAHVKSLKHGDPNDPLCLLGLSSTRNSSRRTWPA